MSDESSDWRPTGNGTLQREVRSAPRNNLTLATKPCDEGGKCEFWISDPEPMDDSAGDWGFAVYMAKDVWIATFTYGSMAAAERAREAICPVLKDAVFIATQES